MDELLELIGALLVVAFFAILWWPSALLVAGLALLLASAVRSRAAAAPEPKDGAS